MKKLITLFLLTFTFNAYAAQQATVNFQADIDPNREGGLALELSEIAGIDYDCGTVSGTVSGVYPKKGNITQPMKLTGNTWTDTTFTPGTWYCGLKTVDSKGRKSSVYSPEVSFTIPVELAPPNYPTGIITKVEVTFTYEVQPVPAGASPQSSNAVR